MSARGQVNRATATKLTRAAQGAALVLGVGAVGAVFAFKPAGAGPAVPEDAPIGPVTVVLPERDTEPLIPDIGYLDIDGLVERISQIDNAPERPEPEEEQGPAVAQEPATPDQSDPTITDRVTYLGHISVGDSMMALLRVDGKQRTARPGGIIPGSVGDGKQALELESVRPGSVFVRPAGSSGASTRVARSAGSAAPPSETTIAAAPRPTPTTPIAVQQDRAARAAERMGDRANGAALEPDPLKRRLDSIQRLYDQGRIDEERYKTMMQRAEEQLQRAQEARNNRDEQ